MTNLRLATTTEPISWEQAEEAFLARDLAPTTRRSYGLVLEALGAALGHVPPEQITPEMLRLACEEVYGSSAPATWNRVLATVRSWVTFSARRGWLSVGLADGLERRRLPEDRDRALSRSQIDRLLTARLHLVRERCLWSLLYDSGARAHEVLGLNVEDLDLEERRARVRRKGGARDVIFWQTRTARLLPKVINGRAQGPLFLASKPVQRDRRPALCDLDPATGLTRLSYRRAAEVFKKASGGATLHQLRHSAITHLAEEGVGLPLLQAYSGHASLRSLQKYARPSADAVGRELAKFDRAGRGGVQTRAGG